MTPANPKSSIPRDGNRLAELHWWFRRQQDQWAQSRASFALAVIATFSAIGALAYVTALSHERLTKARALTTKLPSTVASIAAPDKAEDFATSLKLRRSPHLVVDDLRRFSTETGVTIVDLAIAEQRPSTIFLGRDDFNLTTKGSYPQTKLLLQRMTARHDTNMTVRNLRLRRTDGTSETVEAQMGLSIWSSPLPQGQ